MRTLLIGLLSVCALTLSYNAKADIYEDLKFVASEINRIAPIRVDETTRLLGVEVNAKQLIYHMEVFGELAQGIDLDGFTKLVSEKLKVENCKKSAMEYFSVNDVELLYIYFDLEGMPLSKINIKAQECQFVQSTSGSLGL